MSRAAILLIVLAFSLPGVAFAAETDQYLVWGIELEDSADEIDAWLNEELQVFLARINDEPRRDHEPADDIAIAFMRHVFSVRPLAHINELYNSDALDEYPPREDVNFLQYQRASIYRGPAFPFLLFMARTIRIGDVYLGIDKLSHLFGFGRRYFVDYLKLENDGLDHDEIVKRLIDHGIRTELWLAGRAINGVISRSDLEANYQGLLFAMSLSRGADPLLVHQNGRWLQTRPIQIQNFITPHMDESYYPNQYWAARKRQVLPLIEEKYAPLKQTPQVKDRFTTYDNHPPSLNVQYLESALKYETNFLTNDESKSHNSIL